MPKLQIFNTCKNLITELQTYRWKDLRHGAIIDAPERPLKREDHCVDALRYGVNYLYETPVPKSKDYKFDYRTMLGKSPDDILNDYRAQ
jgi:hypothetical protein